MVQADAQDAGQGDVRQVPPRRQRHAPGQGIEGQHQGGGAEAQQGQFSGAVAIGAGQARWGEAHARPDAGKGRSPQQEQAGDGQAGAGIALVAHAPSFALSAAQALARWLRVCLLAAASSPKVWSAPSGRKIGS